jgi:hypothetical protein
MESCTYLPAIIDESEVFHHSVFFLGQEVSSARSQAARVPVMPVKFSSLRFEQPGERGQFVY